MLNIINFFGKKKKEEKAKVKIPVTPPLQESLEIGDKVLVQNTTWCSNNYVDCVVADKNRLGTLHKLAWERTDGSIEWKWCDWTAQRCIEILEKAKK